MSVFQPLYFAGGRYTAGTDRKLLAAVFGADSSGDRLVGVIPSNIGTDSLRVSWTTGLTVNIATGMCLIADQSAQNNESPSLYLVGVDTNTESITLSTADATDTKYDVIYAEVNETPYFITSKALESNVAELTTSSAHGFVADQTVVVSGVDDVFDGTYVITTAPTSTKFRYAKTHANVASFASPTLVVATATGYPASGTAIVTATINNKVLTSNIATLTTVSAHGLVEGETITVKGLDAVLDGTHQLIEGTTGSTLKYSINKVADDISTVAVSTAGGNSVAVARVPFAIKKVRNASAGVSYPAGITAIELAEITVAANATNISQANINDLRKFVPTSGGMSIYNSTSGATLPGASNPTPGMLRYDVSNNTLQVYDSTSATFKTLYANSGSGEVFARLGSTATTAAAGNHVHDTAYAFKLDNATTNNPSDINLTVSGTSSTSPTVLDYTSITITKNSDIFATSSASFNVTGSAGYMYFAIRLTNSTGGTVIVAPQGFAQIIYAAGYVQLTSSTIFTNIPSGTYRVQPIAYRSSSSTVTASSSYINTVVTPIKAYS